MSATPPSHRQNVSSSHREELGRLPTFGRTKFPELITISFQLAVGNATGHLLVVNVSTGVVTRCDTHPGEGLVQRSFRTLVDCLIQYGLCKSITDLQPRELAVHTAPVAAIEWTSSQPAASVLSLAHCPITGSTLVSQQL